MQEQYIWFDDKSRDHKIEEGYGNANHGARIYILLCHMWRRMKRKDIASVLYIACLNSIWVQ